MSPTDKAGYEVRDAEGYPPVPRYYQRDGNLIIMHANANVQGLYTCTDGTSDDLSVVYVVQAQIPLLRMKDSKKTSYAFRHFVQRQLQNEREDFA